jgi:hypothetical protein
VCEKSVCGDFSFAGGTHLPDPNGQTVAVSSGTFAGFQVTHAPSGWLTAFGVVTAGSYVTSSDGGLEPAPSAHGYIGLYTDNERPDKLQAVAENGHQLTLTLGTSQIFTVTPPVRLMMDATYWIVIVLDENVLFSASTDIVPQAIDFPYALQALRNNSPTTILPCGLLPGTPCEPEPALYMVIAQP